jgi:hypothetical protein
MRTHRIQDLDRTILHYCENDFVLMHDLLKHVARGSLYRHVGSLLNAGLLAKRGRAYRTTEQGKRRVDELASTMDWNIWDRIYLPMQHVPTPPHRAVIELATAAVVARQADSQEDHHPGFLVMGPSLVWKTSEAKFECHLLGVDPAATIVDLTTETGRSLLVRRDGKGNLVFKRDLLDGPLIVFDDLLEAEASLRPTIHHFLCGRKVVPVDNTLLRIAPVSMITLNPRPNKATLEEQTTFSMAQLRRLVVTNLANVALPDLANMGHRALEAAAKQGPLPLPPPTANAKTWRSHIVGLLREILVPQVWSRVDTEMIIVMVTGMSAFIPDPERAIQQTVYDFAITAETLNWTCPGWIDVVSRFSLHAPPPTRRQRDRENDESSPAEDIIILRRSAMDGYKESALPPFTISDVNKARMIAIAVHEHIPFDHALGIVLDYYLSLERPGLDLNDLHSILELSKELKQRSLPVRDVKTTLGVIKVLADQHADLNDFETALQLLPLVSEMGFQRDLEACEPVIRLAGRLLASGVSLLEIEARLTSHQKKNSSLTEEEPTLEQKNRN